MAIILPSIILVFSALAIAWQDFKTRLISIWLIFVFAVSNLWIYLSNYDMQQVVANFSFTICYLLFAYSILHLYYFIKTGTFHRIIDVKIGWGDILIAFSLGICLDPQSFLTFLTSTLVVTIIFVLATKRGAGSIPLAGFLTLFYCLLYLGKNLI